MARKSGLDAALEDDGVKPGAALVNGEALAGDLFSDEELADEDAIAQAMFPGIRPVASVGRPKGARNRNTQEVRKFVQATGADPVIAASRVVRGGPAFVLDQMISMALERRGLERDDAGRVIQPIYSPDKTIIGWEVAPLPVEVKDAWAMWARMVDFLGPYAHSRQPIDVQLDGAQQATMVQIFMGHGSGLAGPAIVGGQRQDPLGPTISVAYVDGQEQVTRDADTDAPESAGVSDA